MWLMWNGKIGYVCCQLLRRSCGLKLLGPWPKINPRTRQLLRRSCGLKSLADNVRSTTGTSASAKKLWIEIKALWDNTDQLAVSFCEEAVDWNRRGQDHAGGLDCQLLRRSCGLKCKNPSYGYGSPMSASAKKLWTEMVVAIGFHNLVHVSFFEKAAN